MDFSAQQVAIFDWFFEPPTDNLVVRARAGTGKTTTIIEAIKHIKQGRILLCAFNKRIQLELEARLQHNNAEAKTLHALGYSFLRGFWRNAKMDSSIDMARIEAYFKERNEALPPRDVVNALKRLISFAKAVMPFGDADGIEALADDHDLMCDDPYWAPKLATLTRAMMDVAKEPDPMGRISFDDMVYIPIVNKFALPQYDWVIIDEAQDMNYTQLLLATAARRAGGHIVVVGDDRQAIYGFAGAYSDSLDKLKEKLKAQELGLNTTYRCPKLVVKVANALVPDYFAAPAAPDGQVTVLAADLLYATVAPGDVVLSRTNAPLVRTCLSLIRRGISAKIEGRDVGKMLQDRINKLHAKSIPDFLSKLSKWALRSRERIIAKDRNVERLCQEIDDIEDTLTVLTEDCDSMEALKVRCEQMFDDNGDARSRRVICSTVHKAKGLEWPRVFLLTHTLYFYGRRRHNREEQNIHYVAVTRAKEQLVLVEPPLDHGAFDR